jgi:hypothetical protein
MISLSVSLTRSVALFVCVLLAHASVVTAAAAVATEAPRPALVILVQFGDESGHTTPAHWRSRFFGAAESVRQHYRDASEGAREIAPADERHGTAKDGVVGWLTLGRPDSAPAGGRAAQLAREAMIAASRYVDFAAFDTDGDGTLSTSELLIVVVVAGHDASPAASCPPNGWSHQSAIAPLPLDGVRLSPYAMVGETECGAPAPLDTITQEIDSLLVAAGIAAAEDDIAPPLATLTLLTPNGGEGWSFDSRRRIEWTSSALSGRVSLEMSRDGGATWTAIAASTDNDGAFNWTVTPPATARARVRVCSVATPALCDASNGDFRIAAAVITVIEPNGGEKWVLNTTRQIQWTSAGPVGGNVRVELRRGPGAAWEPLFEEIANDGAQNWTVTGPASPDARIRVCSVAAPSVCDAGDRNFTITPGAITVLTPNGGESWDLGSTRRIEWRTSGAVGSDVRVELRRSPGAAWEPLFPSIANDGAQNWVVTGPATAEARVRICSVATASICDVSNANFTISDGRVRVRTPNGGQVWPVGGTRRIEWTSSVPGNVRIDVSRDAGASWTRIFTSLANDGAQNWVVTGPTTNRARIRVCSVEEPASCDTSDENFVISEAADLTVRSLFFTPEDVLRGQAWQVRIRTANDGVVRAAASRTDIFVGTTSATGTIRITEMSFNVPALDPGETNDQQKTIAFPDTVPPGTYFVFARVDATGVVPEGNEDNEFVLLEPTLLVH